jgi:hypothetical protein
MKAFAYGIAWVGLALAARSAIADSSLDRVRACMPKPSDAERLACYDRELGRTAAPAAAVPARPVTAATPVKAATAAAQLPATAAATPSKSADFGMTPEILHKQQVQQGIRPAPSPPQSLSAKVAKIGAYGNGLLVVTLDNGQVWEQQETGDAQLAVGDAVKISRGMFGALWLDDASHRRTRVKRIQ